ncbi:lipoprotein NlpI [Gimesia panareensis]|uniref:Lipoprotein NlpI n=1 Tax=Gimesia panareensis TaxID=2527978 RepID=A0A517Q074_9PLAN|nr:HEAT repeat domain-containing protein [Gimesia panareensis]QDT25023.1 lipoprotein NlpI [Gimesia panareensis]
MQIRFDFSRSVTLCLIACLLMPSLVTAQTKSPIQPVRSAGEQNQTNARFRQNLNEIEALLKSRNQKPAHQPPLTKESKLFLVLEDSLKGIRYNRAPYGYHYLLTQLTLVNDSSKTVKLEREQVKAFVDGQPHPFAGLPSNLSNQSVSLGKKNLQLNKLKFEDAVEVPPGKQGSLWIVLGDLPAGPRISDFEFHVTVDGQPLVLNVNRFELGKLKYKTQLLGPSHCLAELTITGELNSINVGSLVKLVDELTLKNIKRFVLYFPDQQTQIEPNVKQWLPRIAASLGTNTVMGVPFPLFPAVITELHLSGEAFKDVSVPYLGGPAPQVTHATEEAAIHAALDSAMEVLPREKIAEQIREGSPAIKVAALISGGRQLTNAELPLVLELTSHKNPRVQEAALYALRYLGDPRAFQKLVEVAQTPPGPLFEMAIASLAESRYSGGQQALLKILKSHPPESQKIIIGVIARNPRPEWGAAIYEYLDSDNQELRQAAIRALVLNGHPRLFEVLSNALKSPQAEIRQVAFQELIKRRDNASESLAMDYVLQQLQQSAPTTEMLTFIDRMKDPRAIPLLFQHLEKDKLDAGLKISLIKTIASIGDESVEARFLAYYPRALPTEKLLILSTLQKLESPQFFELAKQALTDSNHTIVNGAVSGLKNSGTQEAVQVLAEGLDKASKSSTWNTIFGALSTIGTPEARRTIMEARLAGTNADKKRAAQNAMDNIYQRSPGNFYLKKGEQLHRRKEYKEALEEYDTAISIDELLVPAYLAKANTQNTLKQYDAGLKTVDQALEIDDMHARLYVTKGLLYSNQDKPQAALVELKKAIEIAPQDPYGYTVLASHYSRLKQHDQALATYDACIEANPTYMSIYDFKADLEISLNRPDEALKTYDRAIEANSRQMKAYSSKITLLRKLKREHQALAVCDDILKIDKNSIYAYLTKAYIYRDLKQIDEAIAACDAAIQLKPNDPDIQVRKAQIYNDAELWDQAIKVYDRIIRANHKNLDAYTGRGHSNLMKQDWKAAQDDFQKAYNLDNENSQAITGLAICMVYNHQEDKAIQFVESQLKKFEQDALFQYNVACVFGRALINLKDQTKTPAIQQQIAEYQKKAIQYLAAASRLGFNDADWMQKDPDLAELQNLPDFRKLVQQIEKKAAALR